MFYLLNKELSFEVDVTSLGCGMNSALYFITMESDGGQASSGYTGATYGTGYCDAQPPLADRPSCDELDIWEANSLANVYTTHPCLGGQCDAYGCGFNAYARGARNFYGRGAAYELDSTQRFTVVTRFVTVDGTDYGDLKEIQRFYIQNGRTIYQPTVRINTTIELLISAVYDYISSVIVFLFSGLFGAFMISVLLVLMEPV